MTVGGLCVEIAGRTMKVCPDNSVVSAIAKDAGQSAALALV